MGPATNFSALQAIGFATGAALCCMFAALLLRIDRVERVSSPYPWLWAMSLVWNIGNFLRCTLVLAGYPPNSMLVGIGALLAWSIPTGASTYILFIAQRALQLPTTLKRALLIVSTILSVAIFLLFVTAVFSDRPSLSFASVTRLSFASAVVHSALCGLLFLIYRRRVHVEPTSMYRRFEFTRFSVFFMLILLVATVALFSKPEGGNLNIIVQTIAQQWSIPLVIVTATMFADWIYADVVLKRTLRLLVCVCIAAGLLYFLLEDNAGILMVVATIAGAALLFAAPWLKRQLDDFIDTVLLKRPDYDAIARRFTEEVSHAASEAEVMALMQATTRDALKHRAAVDPALIADMPLAKHVPVPTSVSQLFMQGELTFLRTIGKEASRHLEVLASEADRREAKLREERLKHAVTEAELSALRAQVNPHFLFNTLNSIVELISTAPQVAEAMTERLAEFFRYTLLRSQQTLSTLREELEFTRHYLEIESIRFGERLKIQIDGDAKLDDMKVPSLILQPLVENAVRHGIAPKLGGGTVSVSAQLEGQFIQLCVRDDGVGIQTANSMATRGSGVGLRNVRERLRSLHGDKAVVTITSGLNGYGTSVTLLLPIDGN